VLPPYIINVCADSALAGRREAEGDMRRCFFFGAARYTIAVGVKTSFIRKGVKRRSGRVSWQTMCTITERGDRQAQGSGAI